MKKSVILAAYLVTSSLLTACITRTGYRDLYGQALDEAAITHYVVVIHPGTRHINIQGGDSVRFMVDGRTFAWQFNVARTIDSFDLREVAPPGLLDHPVIAYVSPDPKYLGMP